MATRSDIGLIRVSSSFHASLAHQTVRRKERITLFCEQQVMSSWTHHRKSISVVRRSSFLPFVFICIICNGISSTSSQLLFTFRHPGPQKVKSCEVIQTLIAGLQTKHSGTFIINTGNFNHACPPPSPPLISLFHAPPEKIRIWTSCMPMLRSHSASLPCPDVAVQITTLSCSLHHTSMLFSSSKLQ